MNDVDDLSQRLSQLSPTKPSKQLKRPKHRGPYRKKKALNDSKLDPDAKRKRLETINKKIQALADNNGVSIIILLGMVLKNECWTYNRKLALVAECIINSEPISPHISIQEAIYLREECLLTQRTYFRLRKRLLAHGIVLPAEKAYKDGAEAMRPYLVHYRRNPGEDAIGVKSKLKPSLEHTFKDIMDCVERDNPELQKRVHDCGGMKTVNATVKYGLDGSGRHREIGSSHETNVISVMFGVSTVNQGPDIIWSAADSKGHSSPRNIRPWAYIGEKETYDVLKPLVEELDDEVEQVRAGGIDVQASSGNRYHICVTTLTMSMVDGKVIKTLLGLCGSFCTMCKFSKKEAQEHAAEGKVFKMERNIRDLEELARQLTIESEDPEDADKRVKEIDRTITSYQKRQGLTNFPITIQNLCETIPVLHAKIKVFEFVLNLISRQNTTQKKIGEAFKPGEKNKEKAELFYLRSCLRDEFGIKIGVKTGMWLIIEQKSL